MDSLIASISSWFDVDPEIIRTAAITWSLNILAALAIFVIGRWIAKRIANGVVAATQRVHSDATLTRFLRSVVYLALLVMVIIAALTRLGLEMTSFLALLGAAGLAIGLAVKDSLSNFSSGVMLVSLRPFKVGDYVEAAGVAGTIDSISMTSTVFKTLDNRVVLVPNSMIYAGTITNFSALPLRRIDLVITAGGDNIDRVRKVIAAVLEAHERVLKNPEPTVMLLELVGANVQVAVRPWVANDDYWTVRADLLEQIKVAIEKNGLAAAPPHQFVHLVNQA